MDRHAKALVDPRDTRESTGGAAEIPKRNFASRLFGYDIFLSFALGPPPRGTLSYASDLARRLRERDFSVFFSEEEALPGGRLDSTLRTALLRSKTLVVIANRGTLQDPRYVREEVEEFRIHHPDRPTIPINVAGALQDSALQASAQRWLGYEGKIWVDESEEAVAAGIASSRVVERLATAPTRVKSNVKWRWTVRGVIAALLVLVVGLAVTAKVAISSSARARAELRKSVFLRLQAEAKNMISGLRDEGPVRGALQLLAARRIAPDDEVDRVLLGAIFQFRTLDARFSISGVPVLSASINPSGSFIYTRGADDTLRLWNARTGEPIGTPLQRASLQQEVTTVAISPDGSRIVSGSPDGTLRLWDARSGKPIGPPLSGHMNIVTSVAFSPDGRLIVSGSEDNTLLEWNATTGHPIRRILGHTAGITSVAISPDGRLIASGSQDRTLLLWDALTGQLIGTLIGLMDSVTSVAFSPDGRLIVSGSRDGTLRLWDALTRRPIGEPVRSRYTDEASVSFNPDGRGIVYTGGGGHGRIMRTWNAVDGKLIGEFIDIDVRSVTLLFEGKHALAAGEDKTLRVSPAPDAWPEELCKKLTRNMSHKEWREWVSPEIDYVVQCPGLPKPPDEPDQTRSRN